MSCGDAHMALSEATAAPRAVRLVALAWQSAAKVNCHVAIEFLPIRCNLWDGTVTTFKEFDLTE